MAIGYGNTIYPNNLGVLIDTSNPKCWTGSGNTLYDLSGNGRDFTGNGSYVTPDGIRSGATWTCSSTLVNGLLDTDYHTILFLIRFNTTATYTGSTTGSWNKIFEHPGSSGDRSPGIWRYPDNRRLHWTFNPNNTATNFATSSGDFGTNQYYHVGVVKNGGTTTAYVNGEVVLTGSASNPKQAGNSYIRLFPGYPSDIGTMNFLSIYDVPLGINAIKENYNNVKERFNL